MTERPGGRNLPGHWLLLSLLMLGLLGALLLTGYSRHEVGRASTSSPGPAAPSEHAVLFDAGGRLDSAPTLPRTVALTFDDGPDPRWTPAILVALRRAGVPATFFVVGSRGAEHPGLLRSELAAGHQVAAHTFTHAALAGLPAWRARLELSLDQLALAGATGRLTAFLRLPYSSTPAALTTGQRAAALRAAAEGYVVVLSDLDTRDWARPGVDAIVTAATADPPEGADSGRIVLLHDAGGNRAQTVAAIPRIVADYRARGFRFVTVAQALRVDPGRAQPTAEGARRIQGRAFLVVLRVSDLVVRGISFLLIPLGVLALLRTALLMGLAWVHRRRARDRIGDEWWLPPAVVLVPAFNEAVGIGAAIRSLCAQDYPGLQVVVIDDGSTDGTAEVVRGLGLPQVRVIEQANAGKAAALTTGIRATTAPVVVMVDGDTVFAADALRWLVQPLRDPSVGAVSGNTKVGNRRRLLGRWQHLEYVIGFNLDRRAYDLLRCMPTVPGAIGAFRREALDAVGGVPDDTLAEDTDLTMSIVRRGWHVVYEERAHALTEAPDSLGALWKQRYRWCYGTLQAVWKHRASMLGRSSDRRLGLIGLPYLLLFQVLLPLLAPLIDVYALYGLLFLEPTGVIAYWLGFLALQLVAAGYALHLDRERLRDLWALPLQQLVYRQLMYLVVVESVVSALRGSALRWHKLERRGLGETPEAAR